MNLDLASPDEQHIADNANIDDGSRAADAKLYVEFRKEWSARPNEEKSAKEGRPVFDEVEYVRITSPGDRNNVVDQPVNEFHRARFADKYRRWRAQEGNNEEQKTGTPVEQWPELTRGDAEALRYLHIYTVEALVGLDDNVLGKNPGLRLMQGKAKNWLDVATRTAAASQLRAEKEKAEAQNAQLNQQLTEQAKRLAALEAQLLKGK